MLQVSICALKLNSDYATHLAIYCQLDPKLLICKKAYFLGKVNRLGDGTIAIRPTPAVQIPISYPLTQQNTNPFKAKSLSQLISAAPSTMEALCTSGTVKLCGGGGSLSVLAFPQHRLSTRALPGFSKKGSCPVLRASATKTEVAVIRIGTRGRCFFFHFSVIFSPSFGTLCCL